LILTILFKDDEVDYGKSAKEKLAEWSEDIAKSRIISATMHDDGRITVFYWKV
jgi:hypothetical protein